MARQKLIPKLKEAKAAGKIAFFRSKELIIRDRKRQVASNNHSSGRSFTPSPHRNVADLVNVFTPGNLESTSTPTVDESAVSGDPPPSPKVINNRPVLRSQLSNSDTN